MPNPSKYPRGGGSRPDLSNGAMALNGTARRLPFTKDSSESVPGDRENLAGKSLGAPDRRRGHDRELFLNPEYVRYTPMASEMAAYRLKSS